MRLSNSTVTTFRQCPLRYLWEHVEKRPSPRPVHHGWRFGRAVHLGLQAAYDHARHEQHHGPMLAPGPVDAALDALDRALADEDVDDERRADARAQVVDELARVGDVSGEDVLLVEEFAAFHARDGDRGEPVQVVGTIDRADRLPGSGVRVVDYKATDGDPDPGVAERSLQGKIYTVAARRRFPWATHVVFELAFTRSRTSSRFRRNARDVDWLERELSRDMSQTADAMRAGPWEPRPGRWCHTCPYVDECPAQPDLQEV